MYYLRNIFKSFIHFFIWLKINIFIWSFSLVLIRNSNVSTLKMSTYIYSSNFDHHFDWKYLGLWRKFWLPEWIQAKKICRVGRVNEECKMDSSLICNWSWGTWLLRCNYVKLLGPIRFSAKDEKSSAKTSWLYCIEGFLLYLAGEERQVKDFWCSPSSRGHHRTRC